MPFRNVTARLCLALCFLGTLFIAAPASAQEGRVQTSWRLLDYIAVDYRGAVQGGKVISDLEYAEMQEFSGSVGEWLASLPERPAKPRLIEDAGKLRQAVVAKADPAEVERLARTLAAELIAAYPVPLAPAKLPDLARGAALYAQNCASCHGAAGDAKTPVISLTGPSSPIRTAPRKSLRERLQSELFAKEATWVNQSIGFLS